MAKHVVVLAGDEDVVSGKVLTEADGSTLILNENGTYTYYPFKDTATSVCASGNYDVFYGMEAIFELACMTNYGFTEEALQKEVYENMNGYVLNGETTENADTYYICVDSFYTLILHQNQVMEDEAIIALQADTVYAGYYVSELGVLDMTNADTTEAVLFRTPEATYTYNIYDREIQVQDIYLDSSKEIYDRTTKYHTKDGADFYVASVNKQ